MENSVFYSFRYLIGNDFIFKNKVVVKVFFIYNHKNVIKILDIKKRKGASDDYYAAEAKKIIDADIKNNKLCEFAEKYIKKAERIKRLKIVLTTCLSAAIIGGTSFGTWKYIDNIHQAEIYAAIKRTIKLIEALNENSSGKEIKAASDSYNALPDPLKQQIPSEVKAHLETQVKLYERDLRLSTEINDLVDTFSVEETTELEVNKAEAKIQNLTNRAKSMLHGGVEGVESFLSEIRVAIAEDKEKADEINRKIADLDPQSATLGEEVLNILEEIAASSYRAVSYITKESVQKMGEAIEQVADDYTKGIYVAQIARIYATIGTTCSQDNINDLENYYNEMSPEAKAVADEYGFKDSIQLARELLANDIKEADEVITLESNLVIATCLDADVENVEFEFGLLSPRAKEFARDKGYGTRLQLAKEAILADKVKTEEFYHAQVVTLTDTCLEDDIQNVQQALVTYLSTATTRQDIYITSDPYDLQKAIDEAYSAYAIDDETAKTFYDEQLSQIGPDCAQSNISAAQNALNNFLSSSVNQRVKILIGENGKYDLQSKINEAQALYDSDIQKGALFTAGVRNLPNKEFSELTIEEKELAMSVDRFLNGKCDEYHDYMTNRARGFTSHIEREKLANIVSTSNLVITCDRSAITTNYLYRSDGIVRYDCNDGLYMDVRHVGLVDEPLMFVNVNVIGDKETYDPIFDYNKYSKIYISTKALSTHGYDTTNPVDYQLAMWEKGALAPGEINPKVRISEPDKLYTLSIDIDPSFELMQRFESFHIGFSNNELKNVDAVYRFSPIFSELK